jgi:splicing factor 45
LDSSKANNTTGLGAQQDGIVNALSVTTSRNIGSERIIGDIRGGQRTAIAVPDLFGDPSKVVVVDGCVDGIDLIADMERDDGGIVQDIGTDFSARVSLPLRSIIMICTHALQFGEIERLLLGPGTSSTTVYIKYKEVGSAVNVSCFEDTIRS